MVDRNVTVVGNLPGGPDKTRVSVDLDPQGQLSSWAGGDRVLLVDLGDAPGDGTPAHDAPER